MRTHQAGSAPGAAVARLVLTALLVLAGAPGCGPVDDAASPSDSGLETQAQEASALNGMSINGISLNGLSLNGLSLNGLSLNGLSAPEFRAWFNAQPVLNDMVMAYVVRCAVPAGEVRGYTDPVSGRTYSWEGLLGLAPDWASGQSATVVEQQVVSACLAAHANKYGVHMGISVLGRTGRGQAVPYTSSELSTYSKR